jgi:para-aminobenzoate synthetase component 1
MSIRQQKTYSIEDVPAFIKKTLAWAEEYDHFSYFNSNDIQYPFEAFEHFMAIGCERRIELDDTDTFESLKNAYNLEKDWLIGYLGYDLKNQLEDLQSNNQDRKGFYPAYFYIPKHLIHFQKGKVIISSFTSPDQLFSVINGRALIENETKHSINITAAVSKEEYIAHVKTIQEHIVSGDVYELNYCMEFYAQQVDANPAQLYEQLTAYSPTPFSVFQRINDQYLICASPERFIKKTKNRLISQPIKGTIKRGATPEEDVIFQYQLKHDEKERAENMMIVDLVRNDLAKSATPGSVKVEEMFGIYPFKQLHQMISSISAELRVDTHFIDAIKNAFPMGSMTGAPKIMAMNLIERYENSQRGLFSGAVGYITPEGDFDFNVVIRSMFYHAADKTLSFQVGSAITYDSDPEREYDECMLKAKAIQQVLSDK